LDLQAVIRRKRLVVEGRVGTGPTEPARSGRFLPVFTGLKFFLFNKFPLGPPQALVRNELHKFLDMDFFLSKLCRVQVQVQLMLLQKLILTKTRQKIRRRVFLEPLSLTNGKWPGNTGRFLPVFAGFYRSETFSEPAGHRPDRTGLIILDRFQLWLKVIRFGY
jgi:hypothetical protein